MGELAGTSVRSGWRGLDDTASLLIQFDRFEQRAKIALTESLIAFALNDFVENRSDHIFCEYLQQHASLDNVRLHDLRHTFASIGAGASLGLPIVGKLLGHSQPATTARYAHLDADPKSLLAIRRRAIRAAVAHASAVRVIRRIERDRQVRRDAADERWTHERARDGRQE